MVFVGDGNAPAGQLAQPALHGAVDTTPVVREKPFLYRRRQRQLLVMVPGAEDRAARDRAGRSGAPPGVAAPDRSLLHRAARRRHRRDDQRGARRGQAPAPHAGHLPPRRAPPGHAARTRSSSASGWPRSSPTAATPLIDRRRRRRRDRRPGSSSRRARRARRRCSRSAPPGARTITRRTRRRSSTCTAASAARTRGRAASCVTINSNDVLIDNSWLWRADHGAGVGWTSNTSDNGLIVNGDGVTAYGLFVEHFQEYQTLWNGNGGTVYFYQSEMPYDPPDQASWSARRRERICVVQGGRRRHDARRAGARRLLRLRQLVAADNAIETPTAAGVSMQHMVTRALRRRERERDRPHHQRHRRRGERQHMSARTPN